MKLISKSRNTNQYSRILCDKFFLILVPTTLLSLFYLFRTYDKTKNTPIVIFGESIIPGESKTINVEIARLHTTTKLNIPVIVRRSKIDGPVVLFQQEFMEMKLMESKLFGN
jgi:hypothetical protein